MNTKVKAKIIELAKANPNEEICGFVCIKGFEVDIFPCQNIALDKTTDFEMSQEEYFECMKIGIPFAVYHSHPNGPSSFSPADLESSDESTMPFYLYDVKSGEWLEYIPKTYEISLEGQKFCWGINDCYGLCRNYFRQTLGIYIRDYDRDEDFGPSNSNMIMENFEKEGFVKFDLGAIDVKPHDALLFDISNRCPQHLGIFRGQQNFLHHPLGTLSRSEQLNDKWLRHLKYVLRHKTLL